MYVPCRMLQQTAENEKYETIDDDNNKLHIILEIPYYTHTYKCTWNCVQPL